jgi:hypothetical protein
MTHVHFRGRDRRTRTHEQGRYNFGRPAWSTLFRSRPFAALPFAIPSPSLGLPRIHARTLNSMAFAAAKRRELVEGCSALSLYPSIPLSLYPYVSISD